MPFEDTIILGVIVVNIVLTVLLLLIYYKNQSLVRSKLTMGMLFFAGTFLVENLLNFMFYRSLLQQSITNLTLFQGSVNVLEMAGLLLLLYITWK